MLLKHQRNLIFPFCLYDFHTIKMKLASHYRGRTMGVSQDKSFDIFDRPESVESTNSTTTIIEKKFISSDVNNKNLRASLRRYFDTSANAKLQEIFNASPKKTSPQTKSNKRTLSDTSNIPQNLIMEEFTKIKSKKIWNSILENFKKKPQALFSLISSPK